MEKNAFQITKVTFFYCPLLVFKYIYVTIKICGSAYLQNPNKYPTNYNYFKVQLNPFYTS